jgi:hypothetical protein
MATIAKDIVLAVMTLHDGPPPLLHVLEANSQTFVKGEFCFRSAGYLTEIAGDTPAQIYGVAAGPASNDATAQTDNDVEVPCFLADPTTLFEINMLETGLADHVLVASDIGTAMAIQRDTANNKVHLNATIKGGGASVRMFVHRVARGSELGDTNARVLASFLPNFVQQLGTS